jgi:hypothetical protein
VPAAEAGFFPLDQQLELLAGHFSAGVVRWGAYLAGLGPFEQAARVLAEIGQVAVSASSVWRRTQAVGEQFQRQEEEERRQAMALPEAGAPPSRGPDERRMALSMDGMMVHIRQEGWKELKLGAIGEVVVRAGADPQTQERVALAHVVAVSYAAYLGGPERFGELLWAEAQRRGWEQARDRQTLGDGALWIWHQVRLHFPNSWQLVDWYHAKQHLAEAARLLKGEPGLAYERWLNSRATTLYQGQAQAIAGELEQATPATPQGAADLRREAGYFRDNAKRMNYLEMREEEWLLGSGMVEAAAKQYQSRLCGPGMRWSRSGAQFLLPIRTAILNDRFHERFRQAHFSPPV